MQTFLPFPDFEQTARVLDSKRLGKQRVEVIQVLRALIRTDYGWKNHPAVLMWRGYEEALGRYGFECCTVWVERGFGDSCEATMGAELASVGIRTVRRQDELASAGALPDWLGDEKLHLSHRSALVRKDPDYYGPLLPGVPDDLPYHWPVRSAGVIAAEERRRQR
jgi:hypothetical protein